LQKGQLESASIMIKINKSSIVDSLIAGDLKEDFILKA
jgi:hypothetical protein